MVSTPEWFADNSTMSPIQYVIVKKPSAIKSLRPFPYALDVNHNSAVRRLGNARSKRKVIRSGNTSWLSI